MFERMFLVQRILDPGTEDEIHDATLMTADELVHYIDMQDYVDEVYDIYEVTRFGVPVHLHYVGWQPDCLIEFATDDGTVVLQGYGTDH